MANAIAYEQLSPSEASALRSEVDLMRLGEIPMELAVEIGRTHMTVGEVLGLNVGAIITLDRTAGESADLLVNGTPIARGEVVVVEEKFALRITEITEGPQLDGVEGKGAEPLPNAAGSELAGAPGMAAAVEHEESQAISADEPPAEAPLPGASSAGEQRIAA
jgi:flagellar motor switch protein FliN/FliY